MCAAIVRTASIIPVSKINAGLKMFGQPDLDLMAKLRIGKTFIESGRGPVFAFNRTGRRGWRFIDKPKMARAGKTD